MTLESTLRRHRVPQGLPEWVQGFAQRILSTSRINSITVYATTPLPSGDVIREGCMARAFPTLAIEPERFRCLAPGRN